MTNVRKEKKKKKLRRVQNNVKFIIKVLHMHSTVQPCTCMVAVPKGMRLVRDEQVKLLTYGCAEHGGDSWSGHGLRR